MIHLWVKFYAASVVVDGFVEVLALDGFVALDPFGFCPFLPLLLSEGISLVVEVFFVIFEVCFVFLLGGLFV